MCNIGWWKILAGVLIIVLAWLKFVWAPILLTIIGAIFVVVGISYLMGPCICKPVRVTKKPARKKAKKRRKR